MSDPLLMQREAVEQLGVFTPARSALRVWVEGHKGIFDSLTQGWWADARIAEKVLKFADTFEAKVQEAWTKRCAVVVGRS